MGRKQKRREQVMSKMALLAAALHLIVAFVELAVALLNR